MVYASMGPRSSDRGYVLRYWYCYYYTYQLQWVHGPQTVVMFAEMCKFLNRILLRFNGSTVLRPWLWRLCNDASRPSFVLQWVHGPQTVVMFSSMYIFLTRLESFNGSTVLRPWLCRDAWLGIVRCLMASMGPRSSDRGYVELLDHC